MRPRAVRIALRSHPCAQTHLRSPATKRRPAAEFRSFKRGGVSSLARRSGEAEPVSSAAGVIDELIDVRRFMYATSLARHRDETAFQAFRARPGPIRREAGYDAAGRLGRAGPADKVREQGPSNIMPTWRECECPPRSGPDWRDVGRETRTRGAGGPTRAPPRPPRNPPSPARRGLEGAIGPPPPRRSGSRRSGSPAHEKGQPRRR